MTSLRDRALEWLRAHPSVGYKGITADLTALLTTIAAEARAEGRAEERADVVRWLRDPTRNHCASQTEAYALGDAADWLERGAHLPPAPGEKTSETIGVETDGRPNTSQPGGGSEEPGVSRVYGWHKPAPGAEPEGEQCGYCGHPKNSASCQRQHP